MAFSWSGRPRQSGLARYNRMMEEKPMGKDNGWLWFFSIGALAVLLLGLAIYGTAHRTNYDMPATQGDAQ